APGRSARARRHGHRDHRRPPAHLRRRRPSRGRRRRRGSRSRSPLRGRDRVRGDRSEEHTSELQSRFDLVCRLLLEKKKTKNTHVHITPPNHAHSCLSRPLQPLTSKSSTFSCPLLRHCSPATSSTTICLTLCDLLLI